MSIGGIISNYSAAYEIRRTKGNTSGKGFDQTALRGDEYRKKFADSPRQTSVTDIYNRMSRSGGNIFMISMAAEAKSILSQSHAVKGTVENDEYEIQMSSELKGFYQIYDKQSNKYYTIDPARTSLQTDADTGKDYLVQTDLFGELTNAMPVNWSLNSALKEFMGVEEISSGRLNDKYVICRDEFTGIEVMKVRGNEGSVSVLMINSEEDEARLQELADFYKEKYPNLISTDVSAKAMAMLDVMGDIVRTENGIMIVVSNGIRYLDERDSSKSWTIQYSINDKDIYRGIMEAVQNGTIKGGIENASGWEAWFKESGYDYERVLSDEELEHAAGRGSQTKTEIIVKPDGSRALLMTISAGGIETTISLDISDPAEAVSSENNSHTYYSQPVYS